MSGEASQDGAAGGSETRAADGGQVALAGFVFQFFGAASDFALRLNPKRDTEGGGYELLLQFEHEAAGQDYSYVTLHGNGRRIRTLTQCKYSGRPEQYEVQPKELDDIVEKLLDSEQAAERVEHLETLLVLRSNRQPSPGSRRILDVTENRTTDESQLLYKNGRVDEPRDARIVQGLKRLRWEPLNPISARAELQRFASRFGVIDGVELDAGIGRVIEYLLGLGASQGSHRVTRDEFVERLVGHRQPRSLAFQDIAQHLRDDLVRVRQNVLGIAADTRLARRDAQEAELAALTDEALVLITGGGGCGKSALLSEVLDRALNVTHEEHRLAGLLAEAGVASMADLVNSWRTRGTPGTTSDREDQAVARLVTANPGTLQPVLILGLDGVDQLRDDPQWHSAARGLVRYFWRLHRDRGSAGLPQARLLLTCRSVEDVEDLVGDSGGFGPPDSQRPRPINLDLFTLAELSGLCNREGALAPELRRSLSSAISHAESGRSNATDPLAIQTFSERGSGPDPRAAAAVNILRHPVMWHRFLSLTPDERTGVLTGDAAALDRLAERYIDWFCHRAIRRHAWARQDLTVVLGRVAGECRIAGEAYVDDPWVEAVNRLGASPIEPMALAREAASSGMIRRERTGGPYSPHRWSWRHAFILAHLTRSS